MGTVSLFGPQKHEAGMSAEQLRYALLRYGNVDHRYDAEIIRHRWYPREASPKVLGVLLRQREADLHRFTGHGVQVAGIPDAADVSGLPGRWRTIRLSLPGGHHCGPSVRWVHGGHGGRIQQRG